jgi:molybdopterin-binding protein
MSVTISGSGQIIKQVVQGTLTSTVSISGSSWQSTGLTATITPTSASSKILVSISCGAVGSFKLVLE